MKKQQLMTRFTKLVCLLAAAIVAVAGAQVAQAAPAEPGDLPSNIAAPAGTKLFLVGHAVGVQIYSCTSTSTGYGWALVAPRADLYDDTGKLVATHFGGPTWQARDGSYVVGQLPRRVIVDPTAIPWLRLSAAAKDVGTDGDRLSKTTYIQRIATTGGLAPAAAECSADTAGTTNEVAYTADYFFWKAIGD